ncbi:MAG: hypothetical protein ACO34E_09835 [Limisphaerales bacterium]|jgi:hypothetical protein
MKFLITVALLVLVYLGAKSLMTHWGQVNTQQQQAQEERASGRAVEPVAVAQPTVAGGLPALPAHLEDTLAAAKRQGAEAVKIWLKANKGMVQDPRLADVELDYAVLVAGKNFGEAQEVIAAVKARITEDSPVYEKLKKLEKAYQ